jgi:hypothetical protein
METYPVTYIDDPDNEGCFSIFTATDGIDAEVCGKIVDKRWAELICELLNKYHDNLMIRHNH